MNRISFRYKYEIGQYVFHNTPESDKGIIVDVTYNVLLRLVCYVVAFGARSEDQVECYEHELREDKLLF